MVAECYIIYTPNMSINLGMKTNIMSETKVTDSTINQREEEMMERLPPDAAEFHVNHDKCITELFA